jgi:cellobiose phosphorylase
VLAATTSDAVAHYRGEPYVVAADVYSMPPHVGRAGWTWYTGSASWLYRVALEDILGLRREGNLLRFEPCVPASWPSFEVRYRVGKSEYRITIAPSANPDVGPSVVVDGVSMPDGNIRLSDDGSAHTITIGVAEARAASKPRSA